jgi:hypothetical protein
MLDPLPSSTAQLRESSESVMQVQRSDLQLQREPPPRDSLQQLNEDNSASSKGCFNYFCDCFASFFRWLFCMSKQQEATDETTSRTNPLDNQDEQLLFRSQTELPRTDPELERTNETLAVRSSALSPAPTLTQPRSITPFEEERVEEESSIPSTSSLSSLDSPQLAPAVSQKEDDGALLNESEVDQFCKRVLSSFSLRSSEAESNSLVSPSLPSGRVTDQEKNKNSVVRALSVESSTVMSPEIDADRQEAENFFSYFNPNGFNTILAKGSFCSVKMSKRAQEWILFLLVESKKFDYLDEYITSYFNEHDTRLIEKGSIKGPQFRAYIFYGIYLQDINKGILNKSDPETWTKEELAKLMKIFSDGLPTYEEFTREPKWAKYSKEMNKIPERYFSSSPLVKKQPVDLQGECDAFFDKYYKAQGPLTPMGRLISKEAILAFQVATVELQNKILEELLLKVHRSDNVDFLSAFDRYLTEDVLGEVRFAKFRSKYSGDTLYREDILNNFDKLMQIFKEGF